MDNTNKGTGCPECDKVEFPGMCIDCEIAYLDACIARDMERLEELKHCRALYDLQKELK